MFTFQQATPDDAEQIARIVVEANEGVAEHILNGLVPGLDSVSILSAAFIRGEGPYRTANVLRSHDGERITRLLFSYPAEQHRIPMLLSSLIPAKRLTAVRIILEKSVPESLFINTIWLEEGLRGSGKADAVMLEAESLARAMNLDKISLTCWNDNDVNMRFFARHGFGIVEHFGPEQVPLEGHGKGASLMCKILKDS